MDEGDGSSWTPEAACHLSELIDLVFRRRERGVDSIPFPRNGKKGANGAP